MPGTYVVNYSDPLKPPIEIPPLGADGTTSVGMVGYRAPVYGELLWENFLHLLEHFASQVPPANPTTGQIWVNTSSTPARLYFYDSRATTSLEYLKWHLLDTAHIQYTPSAPANGNLFWYDSAASTLRYNDGDSWDALTAISGAVAPANPYKGQLWHDTSAKTLRYWDGTGWASMTAISAGSAPTSPRVGDLWNDTDRNTLRYWSGSNWNALTNIASGIPPGIPHNGQLWLNTSASPPEMFFYDSRSTTISTLPNWHRMSAGIHIGTTPPVWNDGMWYNPSTGTINLYLGGGWTNILTTNFAGSCDYNLIATDTNVLLARISEPLVPLVTTTSVSASEWNALFDKVRQLSLYSNLHHPKPGDIVNLGSNLGTHSSTDSCGLYSIRRRLRIVEQVLCQVGGAGTGSVPAVNPACLETGSVADVRTAGKWNRFTHTLDATFATVAALDEFFYVGGYLTWTGSIVSPTDPVNDVWEALVAGLSGIAFRAYSTAYSGVLSPVGISSLGSVETLMLQVAAPTRASATVKVYGRRVGATVTLRIVLSEGVASLEISGSTLSSFGVVRVGAPCKPIPLPFPGLSGEGTVLRHTRVYNHTGVPLQEIIAI